MVLATASTLRSKNRGGTKQLYGIRRLHVPMQPRPCLITPSGGILRRSVPETSPCHVQAKQDGELDPLRAAFDRREHSPRNRDRGKLVIGNRQRIGSVRCRLGTWAASAGSFAYETSVTGTAANPIG